jgi:putative hydrolase of the HAD superfamily
MIKAVFFDAAGTLLHLPRGVGYNYRAVMLRHGIEVCEKKLNDAFRVAWKAMPARAASLRPRPGDDKPWWRELVARVASICAIPQSASDRLFEELYAHFALPGVWELYPEVREVMETLSRNYCLGIISNFDGRLRTILGHLDLAVFFKSVTISSEVGADKPHPFIFEAALKSLGVASHEAIHVGDDPVSDWQGAEAAGMACFPFDRTRNSLTDLLPFLQARAV